LRTESLSARGRGITRDMDARFTDVLITDARFPIAALTIADLKSAGGLSAAASKDVVETETLTVATSAGVAGNERNLCDMR
jgi:hypothetical protein